MIQEQLAAELSLLQVLNSVAERNNSLRDQLIATTDGDAVPDINDDAVSSDNDEYNLTSNYLLSPSPRQRKKKVNNKSSKPKVVLDRSFTSFLQPETFNNQPFRKSQQLQCSITEMDCFDAE